MDISGDKCIELVACHYQSAETLVAYGGALRRIKRRELHFGQHPFTRIGGVVEEHHRLAPDIENMR